MLDKTASVQGFGKIKKNIFTYYFLILTDSNSKQKYQALYALNDAGGVEFQQLALLDADTAARRA